MAARFFSGKKDSPMKSASLFLAISFAVCAQSALALQPPALGPVYPVIEVNLLDLMKQHAAEESANTASRLNQSKNLLKNWSKEPMGRTLPEATEVKRHHFESSADAKSFLGEAYQREWLFIDGANSSHVKLARSFYQDKAGIRRLILIHGSVEKVQKTLNQRVWFDQAGTLLKRLRIEALPAFVKMNASGITVTQAPVSDFLKGKDLQ